MNREDKSRGRSGYGRKSMDVETRNETAPEAEGAFLSGSYLPTDPTRLSGEGVEDGAQLIRGHGVGAAA